MVELAELRKKIEHELAVEKEEDIAIIKLVEDLMEYAYHSRASDVHIDPELDRVRIRLRVDGVLQDAFVFPKKIQQEIITRIKVLSGLRTDEHQAAQDGRFRAAVADVGYVDVRVSIAPTYDGENAVMRVLAEHSKILSLNDLGMNERDFKCVKEAIRKPYGMILATGPTGSGKTTTLYTIIKELNTDEISIITIEDPIEYSIGGIDQIQVNPRTGLTFAAGLRSILRQDPNIIMVGEIRDEETAGIAVNAALTGHLMLSSIHTNNAATTLPRLMDMKIEPFLIASTVNVAIGQRLVRRICSDCRIKKKMSDAEFKSLSESLPPKLLGNRREFYVGKGCMKCNNSGYYGRLGIYEVLSVDEEMRRAIMQRANTDEINNLAAKSGMTTMLEDGFKKAIEGKTTIEEVLRVIHE